MADTSNRGAGLIKKYNVNTVSRVDGKPIEECIVLEFKDPIARPAIKVWGDEMDKNGYSAVAADVRILLGKHQDSRYPFVPDDQKTALAGPIKLHFNDPNKPSVELHPNGDFLINGKVVTNDMEVFNGFKCWLYEARRHQGHYQDAPDTNAPPKSDKFS